MAEVRPELIFVDGPQLGERAVLMDNIVIVGRGARADIHIREECVSRQHLRFTLTHDGWIVENLSAAGKIQIDGKKYKAGKKILLESGDCIAIGAVTKLLFVEASDNPDEVLVAYRENNPPPKPVPVPIPPPLPTPVEQTPTPPEPAEPESTEPVEMLPIPEQEEEEKTETPEQADARKQKAKKRMYIIAGGVYIVLMIVGIIALSTLKKSDKPTGSNLPPRLNSEQIKEALTTPLERAPNPVRADIRLNDARSFFAKRSASPENLYLCVLNYRLSLAHRRRAERVLSTDDEPKFHNATRELIKAIQETYDDAWAFENTKQWSRANEQLEQIMRYIPIPTVNKHRDKPVRDGLIQNVERHSRYVNGKMSVR
ncbi:MAG: FHA domain-containing protein [Phycisphaerae bacterium]|nr:FHA domain-containing protein [Phycisphaerae bacterium]